MTEDPLESMKKGGLKQGLKVLVNNQPYMSNNQVSRNFVKVGKLRVFLIIICTELRPDLDVVFCLESSL